MISENTNSKSTSLNQELAVVERYTTGAQEVQAALCCPVDYETKYLEILPEEILMKDYGCGDPSAYVRPEDVVVDLGSGGGKVCYITSQIVGPKGKVIGVDCNPEMLALARKYQSEMAEKIGYGNVEFRAGMIQDLQLDLDLLAEKLKAHPIGNAKDWLQMRLVEQQLRQEQPMIANDSVDCVISNCVLNLVRPEDRKMLFSEVFRVLKRGGRACISDVVCDELVPEEMQNDPKLWSGCISGAFREDLFLKAFEEAGFHGIHIAKRDPDPWQVVEGIEFRAVTVVAYKGKQGPCLERNQAVVYRGPFNQVTDDDGHVYRRGERMAVCDKTFRLLQQEPYAGMFEAISPRVDIPLEEAEDYDSCRIAIRSPQETKGETYKESSKPASDCCGPDESSCC
ncbi:MAG: methyltransferase domain-containing protein [Gemmataceae bacterium]